MFEPLNFNSIWLICRCRDNKRKYRDSRCWPYNNNNSSRSLGLILCEYYTAQTILWCTTLGKRPLCHMRIGNVQMSIQSYLDILCSWTYTTVSIHSVSIWRLIRAFVVSKLHKGPFRMLHTIYFYLAWTTFMVSYCTTLGVSARLNNVHGELLYYPRRQRWLSPENVHGEPLTTLGISGGARLNNIHGELLYYPQRRRPQMLKDLIICLPYHQFDSSLVWLYILVTKFCAVPSPPPKVMSWSRSQTLNFHVKILHQSFQDLIIFIIWLTSASSGELSCLVTALV